MAESKETKSGPSRTTQYFVHIIESPSAKDLLNGRVEGRVLTEGLSLAGIISNYNLAVDLSSFQQAIRLRLFKEIQQTNRVPILHLSAHGSKEGITLTDDTLVDWRQLGKYLSPANNVLRGRLLVCMSLCSGLHGIKMAMTCDRQIAPFFAIVGHEGTINWSDCAFAFVTFYHRLFKGASPDEAVRAMKCASGEQGFSYVKGSQVDQIWHEELQKLRRECMSERVRKFLQRNAQSKDCESAS